MVVNAPLPGPAKPKRSFTSMQSGYDGWESSSPLGVPELPTPNLPFEHYAIIYWDDGKVKVAESPSIQGQGRHVLTAGVRDRFRDVLGPRIGYQKPMLHRTSMGHTYNQSQNLPLRHGKRRKGSSLDLSLGSFGEHIPEPVPQVPSPTSKPMMRLQIGNTAEVTEYYWRAFDNVKQQNCRTLAKAFIKVIEPKKQRDHPYNGNIKGSSEPREKDPEKTKPLWWPAEVQHTEPDHLQKLDRVDLLVHILRTVKNLPQMHPKYKEEITAAKLQEIAQDQKRQLSTSNMPEDPMAILNEIFKVRALEERYEEGGVDAGNIAFVRKRDRLSKEPKEKDSKDSQLLDNTEPKIEGDEEDDYADEGGEVTTATQNLPSLASVNPSTLQHRSHFSINNDPFNINESLSFPEPSRHARSFYPTTIDYTEDYSQSMMRPSTSAFVGSHPEPAFDYLTNAPFTTAPTNNPHRPMSMSTMPTLSHYDAWDPTFRPNLYSTLDYGASQTLAQNPMHYPLSISPSQAELSHGLPETASDRKSDWASLNRSF